MTRSVMYHVFLPVLIAFRNIHIVMGLNSSTIPTQQTYNYFAFGSNMASSTMTALRGLTPLASTPAILPGHRLCFNIPGVQMLEPSWASVEPSSNPRHNVHGILYQLTSKDFIRVCQSEGVPLTYQLHRCRVIPYMSNLDRNAGQNKLQMYKQNPSQVILRSAFTLRAAKEEWRIRPNDKDIPPSRSYIRVLLQGAEEYGLDEQYIQELKRIKVDEQVTGIAEWILKGAEQYQKMKPNL